MSGRSCGALSAWATFRTDAVLTSSQQCSSAYSVHPRIAAARLAQFRCVKERDGVGSYEVMHSNVDPSDQIFLGYILRIEKVVKVDGWHAGQVKVPYTARRRFRFLATGNCEIASCPVGVLEALGAYDGLCRQSNICSKWMPRTVLTPWMGEYPGWIV